MKVHLKFKSLQYALMATELLYDLYPVILKDMLDIYETGSWFNSWTNYPTKSNNLRAKRTTYQINIIYLYGSISRN